MPASRRGVGLSLVLLAACATAGGAVDGDERIPLCFGDRWDIRTMRDKEAKSMDWTPVPISIDGLTNLARPTTTPTSRFATETHVYAIRGKVISVGPGDQASYKAVIESPTGNKVHVEALEPACTFGTPIGGAGRDAYRALRGMRPGDMVEVTGVGYWHPSNKGPTGRMWFELYPVLSAVAQ